MSSGWAETGLYERVLLYDHNIEQKWSYTYQRDHQPSTATRAYS